MSVTVHPLVYISTGASNTQTVPTGVTPDMTALLVLGTETSTARAYSPTPVTVAGTATFETIMARAAGNSYITVIKAHGLTSGDTFNFPGMTWAAAITGIYTAYDYGTLGNIGVRTGTSTTVTSGSLTVAAGDKVTLIATERTLADTLLSSVAASDGGSPTLLSYAEEPNSDNSFTFAEYTAATSSALTATVTYTVGSGNALAVLIRQAGTAPTGPTAEFLSESEGLRVDLDGGLSTGAPTNYEWDFGDGTAKVNTASTKTWHLYSNPGTYTVALRVTDAGGSTSVATTHDVTVDHPVGQYFTDFSEYTVGVSPSDWSNRWDNSLGSWLVQAAQGFGGSKNALALTHGASQIRMALSWNKLDADANRADVEILYRFTADATGPDVRILARGSGTGNSGTGYNSGYVNGTTRNSYLNAGASVTIANGPGVVGFVTGDWWWVRSRVVGTSLQTRIWADGTPEPTTWDVESTDSTITAAGWVGLTSYVNAANIYWDQVSVGTGGKSAPSLPVDRVVETIPAENTARFLLASAPTSSTGVTSTTGVSALATPTVGALNVIWVNVVAKANLSDPGEPTIDGQSIATSGWNLIGSSYDSGSPGVRLTAAWRIYQDGDPSQVTWGWNQVGNHVAGGASYVGFDPANPVPAGVFAQQAPSSTAFATGTLVTDASGLICSLFSNRTTGTWTLPDTARSTGGSSASSANYGLADSGFEMVAGSYQRTGVFSAGTSVGNTGIWLIRSAVQATDPTAIDEWIAAAPFYCAHRGGSADWVEESMLAYDQSVLWGVKALEISVFQSTDGVWVCSHDQSTLRVTGVDKDIKASTWADLQPLRSLVGNQPLVTMNQVLDKYAADHIIFVDNKGAQSLTAFFDLLDSYGGSDRFVSKSYYTSNTMASAAHARGYKTWGYYYDVDAPNIASTQSRWDILGMDFNATQDTWNMITSYGKPVMGHIVPDAAAAATAFSKGANGLMVSKVTAVIPRTTTTKMNVYTTGTEKSAVVSVFNGEYEVAARIESAP